MDFALSRQAEQLSARMWDFMRAEVFPAEPVYARYLREHGPHEHPPVMDKLMASARERGLWNLFLPSESGLSNLDYAAIAEISGWSPVIAPEAINCQAPDTGNMELLHLFGTPEQKERWLRPLLDGEIRSGFSMTEPDVASSDATNITTAIRRDGDEYVINGRKWWTSGALDERCAVFILMGKTDPAADVHRQQSMILVPRDTPGVTIERDLPIFGFSDQHGHAEIVFRDVRVPASNLIGGEGDGFMIAQARLGPGRIHHAMRAIGMAERALALMVDRARSRVAFGQHLSDQGAVRDMIAQSRIE
ncbi:MAG: acyl-CoA dehydrogenase family protein, partial [Actinomycetota bacterium]|nr:acyl-CoA dehydrogenase family protein [Actinomycetota bacterium]